MINLLIYSLIGVLFGIIYRTLLRRFAKTTNRKLAANINNNGRLTRLMLGLLLLGCAYLIFEPIALIAGFCFYEAAFSWCGVNALFGKNECSIR